jgi:uncharacterized cupin superfamily protein
MPKLRLPALDPTDVEPRTSSAYPPRYVHVTKGRAKHALANALGLAQFGVNVTELAPGAASALRHWHTHEDEFVFVLVGELTLITDEGKQVLRPGQCAGFPAGVANGHCLVNESNEPARYLEVGSRRDEDEAHYPDVDLHVHAGRYAGPARFTRKNGSPVE